MNVKSVGNALICLILAAFLVATAPLPQEEWKLIDSFEAAGARPELYMLHHGGRTAATYSKESVSALAVALSRSLHLSQARPVDVDEGEKWSASGRWQRNLQVQLTVINDEPKQPVSKPYISIRITGRGHPGGSFARAKVRMIQALKRHRIQPRTHFSIQGRIPAHQWIPNQDKNDVIRKVFRRLEAHEVEAMRTGRTVSVSAYSPAFTGGLRTRGGIMNVQAAAKDSHNDQSIIFTLGTPIITIEY